MNRVVLGSSCDPWHNLAFEELLFDQQEKGMTLYLWQSQNTVVIGRFQNAWKECQVPLLEKEGGRLARRSSGGGAVFHDRGNLNFTFLTSRQGYDALRQFSVIQRAVRALGVESVRSGKSDLSVKSTGEKFSGNAFRLTNAMGMHHGTLLIQVDMEKLSRYLVPSQEKLVGKGVQSVRARVRNLSDCSAAVNITAMKEALITAFIEEYGEAETYHEDCFWGKDLQGLEEKYRSWDWRFGKTPEFNLTLENRFRWGSLTFNLAFSAGLVKEAQVYSDYLDGVFVEGISQVIHGCPMSAAALAQRILALGHPHAVEIARWLSDKDF